MTEAGAARRDDEWYDQVGMEDIFLTAPPGCGKTEGIAKYVAHLLEDRQIEPPAQVLAMTFTSKAVANLGGRIRQGLGGHSRRRIHVTSFHGMAYRLVRAHASTVGLDPEIGLPRAGWLSELRRTVGNEHGVHPSELLKWVRGVKSSAPREDEIFDALFDAGGDAAVVYEQRLRAALRLDFDDALNQACRILGVEEVGMMYRARFRMTIIDESQDLSRTQFRMAVALAGGPLLFAGDTAQGIFEFAGAAPGWVYAQIAQRHPREVRLSTSYRSSPEVLRVVSATSTLLGGEAVTCALPDEWNGRGHVSVMRSPNTWHEAASLVELLGPWMAEHPNASVGVMARVGWRRREFEAAARDAGWAFEIWDYPIHKPRIVDLLRRHLPMALARAETDEAQMEELWLLCFEEVGDADFDTLDDLNEAFDQLRELIGEARLQGVIHRLRADPHPDAAVSPGLHVLTGHAGKGQQFDFVVVLGLEQDILPVYRATTEADLRAELSVLHVMVSRARERLIITVSRDVRSNPDREWLRQESRWLPVIEAACAP